MKKIQRLGLVLVMLFAAHSAMAAIMSPVRLVYASPRVGGDWHDVDLYTDISVHVDTMDGAAGTWTVSVRYQDNMSGSWRTLLMRQEGDYGTHRLYDAYLSTACLRFEIVAVRRYWHPVTGRLMTETYRDNNEGAYYSISAFGRTAGTTAGAVGGKVGLVEACNYSRVEILPGGFLYNQYVAGQIVVPYGTATPAAGVRMITDSGAVLHVPISSWTVHPDGDNGLAWGRFEQRIATRVTKPNRTVKIEVDYRDPLTGQALHDDNFGQGYTVRTGETVR